MGLGLSVWVDLHLQSTTIIFVDTFIVLLSAGCCCSFQFFFFVFLKRRGLVVALVLALRRRRFGSNDGRDSSWLLPYSFFNSGARAWCMCSADGDSPPPTNIPIAPSVIGDDLSVFVFLLFFTVLFPFARHHDAVFSPFVCDFHIIILTTYPHPFCFPRFPLDCCSETRNGRGKGTSDAEWTRNCISTPRKWDKNFWGVDIVEKNEKRNIFLLFFRFPFILNVSFWAFRFSSCSPRQDGIFSRNFRNFRNEVKELPMAEEQKKEEECCALGISPNKHVWAVAGERAE